MLANDDRLHEMRQRDENLTDLFVRKEFTSHSGKVLRYKIECDALSDGSWDCFAAEINLAMQKMGGIKEVHGIPRGGMKLASLLQQYVSGTGTKVLVVDDVLTTGRSIEAKREELVKDGVAEYRDIIGFTVFNRAMYTTHWIHSFLFVGSVFRD